MDQKNRLIIAIAVTLLIVAAMFTSFGRSLFSMRTEHIQLPEPGASSSSQEGAPRPSRASSAPWSAPPAITGS